MTARPGEERGAGTRDWWSTFRASIVGASARPQTISLQGPHQVVEFAAEVADTAHPDEGPKARPWEPS